MTRCPWWIRWWHRRLRRLDERFVRDTLVRQFRARAITFGQCADAWTMHKALPGQGHWRCACASEDAWKALHRALDEPGKESA